VKDDRVRDERVLVYSTDGTLPLPAPTPRRKPPRGCHPELVEGRPAQGDLVRVTREKRRNSAMTVVHGLAATEVDALGKELKRRCGTGGTVKNGLIELQGDHRDAVIAFFAGRGRRVKRAGG